MIRRGRVIDPASAREGTADLWISKGRIAGIGEFRGRAEHELDAAGLVVAPGLVDMHVHLREPGQEWKEDIRTGSRAAVAGGVTTVCCMPNTNPVIDTAAVASRIRARAEAVGLCDVHPIGAVTRGLQGTQLTEMRELARAGCVAFSDDGMPIWHAGVMRRALEYASSFGFLIIQHAEEKQLTEGGAIHEGWVATQLGVRGMPAEGEACMIARDLMLAEKVGARYHVAHISAARSVALVREARARGVKASAEAAPHHFALTEEAVLRLGANAKMSPPLREEADRRAIIEGLKDGTIEVIATDHAPHHEDEKNCGLECAAFGVIGLETMLPVSLTLVREGHLGLSELLAKMTCNPARLLGLAVGVLRVGARADLCLFDPEARWELTPERIHSRSKNSPWLGETLTGQVRYTFYQGRLVFAEGEVISG
ncbi:MAG: dihydroorotase [Zetaproteobacteria bacterium]|nr:MAG: dihydroorotase [Zetaproteobacteria bacterium]